MTDGQIFMMQISLFLAVVNSCYFVMLFVLMIFGSRDTTGKELEKTRRHVSFLASELRTIIKERREEMDSCEKTGETIFDDINKTW